MSKDKFAVITGASSGIGAATVQALLSEGYSVIATARRKVRLAELAAGNPQIHIFPADLTLQSDVDALAQITLGNMFGHPACLDQRYPYGLDQAGSAHNGGKVNVAFVANAVDPALLGKQ